MDTIKAKKKNLGKAKEIKTKVNVVRSGNDQIQRKKEKNLMTKRGSGYQLRYLKVCRMMSSTDLLVIVM